MLIDNQLRPVVIELWALSPVFDKRFGPECDRAPDETRTVSVMPLLTKPESETIAARSLAPTDDSTRFVASRTAARSLNVICTSSTKKTTKRAGELLDCEGPIPPSPVYSSSGAERWWQA